MQEPENKVQAFLIELVIRTLIKDLLQRSDFLLAP